MMRSFRNIITARSEGCRGRRHYTCMKNLLRVVQGMPSGEHDRCSYGAELERPFHLAVLVALDDIALFHIAEAVDANTAVKARAHFADVVLEALKR